MRHCIALSVMVLTAACAGTPAPGGPPVPDQTVRTDGSSGGSPMTMSIAHTTSPSVRTVSAPADRVWNALPAVFASLGIPIEERDVGARSLGNPALKVRRRLGDVSLNRYLDCGSTQGGQSADTYEIVMSVMTYLRPAAEGTEVTTIVEARGSPVVFSAEYVTCGTRGALEQRFFDALNQELKR